VSAFNLFTKRKTVIPEIGRAVEGFFNSCLGSSINWHDCVPAGQTDKKRERESERERERRRKRERNGKTGREERQINRERERESEKARGMEGERERGKDRE